MNIGGTVKKVANIAAAVVAVIIIAVVVVKFIDIQKKKAALKEDAGTKERQSASEESSKDGLSSQGTNGDKKGSSFETSKIAKLTSSKTKKKKINYLKVKSSAVLFDLLKEGLNNNKENLVAQAVKGLEVKGEDVVGFLRQEIIDNFSQPQVRRNAVWGLFYSSKPDAVTVLKTVLKADPDEQVRYVALFALDSICGKQEMDFIKGIAETDTSLKVREKAAEFARLRSTNQ